jgi:hypothetical protein
VIRLYVLVEGRTEEEFVKGVLAPHLAPRGIWTLPVVVQTSRDASGHKRRGGGRWKNWLRDLRRLTGEQRGRDVRFTTLFDLYGLPDDFPGPERPRTAPGAEAAMARAVRDRRLIPYVQRHEFEALVLAAIDAVELLVDGPADREGVRTLRSALDGVSPEDVDDGPTTAPSKRLERLVPGYRKIYHGPLALQHAGVARIRAACPRFDRWVATLEALAGEEA